MRLKIINSIKNLLKMTTTNNLKVVENNPIIEETKAAEPMPQNDNLPVMDNPPPPPLQAVNKTFPTKKWDEQPEIKIPVNPAVTEAINQMEDEIKRYEVEIKARKYTISVLQTLEAARSGNTSLRSLDFEPIVPNSTLVIRPMPVMRAQ